MTKRNTKEMILAVALKLFSDRGYDGVGLREIAGEVGVSESAIYKHFGSKQDIFESIIQMMEEKYEENMRSFHISEQISPDNELQETLYKMCLLLFHLYLCDEKGSQLRRMLTIELVKNTAAGKAYKEKLIDTAVEYISGVFSLLMTQGYYKKADPYVMALQFYSPLYLLILTYDRQPERYEEAVAFLEKHIQQFDLLNRR